MEEEDEGYIPMMLNRVLVLIIPKQPFYDWERQVFPELNPMNPNRNDYDSFLLNNTYKQLDLKKLLKEEWAWIFENQLHGICTDEDRWPKKRTWKMFTEWFDVKYSSIITDLGTENLVDFSEFDDIDIDALIEVLSKNK